MDEVIVVGGHSDKKYQKENDIIADIISSSGFAVERSYRYWPRNLWVYNKGKYFSEKEHGLLGHGGMVLVGDGFVLISDKIFWCKQEKVTTDTMVAESTYKLKAYSIPAPISPKDKLLYHIDLSCLVVDSKKKIIIDNNYYKRYDEQIVRSWFADLQKDTGYEVIFFSPKNSDESGFFPCNTLLVDDKAFTNEKAPEFMRLLKDLGMNVSAIPVAHLPELTGSIRCATNIKERHKPLEELADIEERMCYM